jgi:RimJ/RimL family protein N-acetyltransferase
MPQKVAPVHAEIRRLVVEDAEAFSHLRREVTADNPVPMGLSLDEELSRPIEGFRSQLSSPLPNAVFGAFVAGELVATAAVSRPSHFTSSGHKMVMWGVFTSPRFRRRGLSRLVVEQTIRHALVSGAVRINLLVYVPNEAALTLYSSLGFIECGLEPEAVHLNGQYFDGAHMSLRLEQNRTGHAA